MAKRRDHPIEPRSDDFDWLLSIAPFRVPRYQRAYDWDLDEVRDFARDVHALAERRIAGGQGRHFFGAVISILHKSDHYHEVVDGQQRLATEIICLNELLGEFEGLASPANDAGDSAIQKEARKHIRYVKGRLEDDNGPRLALSRRDDRFFVDLLADTAAEPRRGDAQSHRRLWAARATVQVELFDPILGKRADRQATLTRLIAIERALLEDGYVVHLFTEESGEAYRLFSVLNDRGRPLSDGSLLRTHSLAVLENWD